MRRTIHLAPDNSHVHTNLSGVLVLRGRIEEAVREGRVAVRLEPHSAAALLNLGSALGASGKFEESVRVLHRAIDRDPTQANVHYNLGIVLERMGRVDDAIASYQRALECKPDMAEAHCNLAIQLAAKGELSAAVAEMRVGHELGSRVPQWPHPSAAWVADLEERVELSSALHNLMQARTKVSAARRAKLAQFALTQAKDAKAAAQLYSQAFSEDHALEMDLDAGHRYNAACAALLAFAATVGASQESEDPERLRMIGQAIDWLH